MFFKRRREKRMAEEQRAREMIEQARQKERDLARKLARRQERMEQRAREKEVYGESAEQARKYDAVAKRLFELVVELSDGVDLLSEDEKTQITDEINRTGDQLDNEGGVALMEAVCGRVTELGHAAADKAHRDASELTYSAHQRIQDLNSAGRILEEEWKGIGQWR